jgi:hypothetical protein
MKGEKINVRADEYTVNRLNDLCKAAGKSQGEVIESLLIMAWALNKKYRELQINYVIPEFIKGMKSEGAYELGKTVGEAEALKSLVDSYL